VLRDLRAPAAEEEQRFEAAGVAQAARARGGGSSGVLDALEAAEAAQEAADDRRGEPHSSHSTEAMSRHIHGNAFALDLRCYCGVTQSITPAFRLGVQYEVFHCYQGRTPLQTRPRAMVVPSHCPGQ